jgi:glutaredoxin
LKEFTVKKNILPVFGYASIMSAALLLTASLTQAQTVYKVVGADGKVTFSDKPPVASANATVTGAGGKVLAGAPALPFELRQVVSKYPVTLYTSNNCVPCGSGRAMLSNRGTPFTEKTVSTNEDIEALQRLSGDSSLPFLTVGGQQLKGYSDSEWTQFLDAAGYPKASVLPAGYRNPAATPLVVIQKPAAKTEEPAARRAPAEPARPSVDPIDNPAGIKF